MGVSSFEDDDDDDKSPNTEWNWNTKEALIGEKGEDKKRGGRTMDTSFVVSAAFCAPVVTESQNDMAVFVAIAVWTEMVACGVSKAREQHGRSARCFLTTFKTRCAKAYLSTRPFFATPPQKKKRMPKGIL